mmetsp:Transcript_9846/g.14418  ORF Transcript_9846/g.14418 Transcript_9846/m.14418 type:complete len:165 (+) Transcript_9846:96-590(+)|eukprot:CAMPEP_0195521560 /NCGR_PEP_ID=MMETSP0794_2-20130614/18949_1 /TAXON_ID=515487 /ORGANISM="Stephanopyxis turris, Strain CCMP 815" /LENGTH=164 /DNA_ID=CAMNT_0040651137 /DNA_START=96 /DNA_END=590 /DNA_ORIENTATION=-
MGETDQQVNTQGKNKKPLLCKHCGSQFISSDKCERVEHERSQKHFQQLANGGQQEGDKKETISSSFWMVPDVWDFDNIGQTRAVPSVSFDGGNTAEKVYLVCADCDKGPVGIRWAANEPYYVAHSAIAYEKPKGAPENGTLPPGMSEDFVRGLIAQQQQQKTDG